MHQTVVIAELSYLCSAYKWEFFLFGQKMFKIAEVTFEKSYSVTVVAKFFGENVSDFLCT